MKVLNTPRTNKVPIKTPYAKRQSPFTSTNKDSFKRVSFKANPLRFNTDDLRQHLSRFLSDYFSLEPHDKKNVINFTIKELNIRSDFSNKLYNALDGKTRYIDRQKTEDIVNNVLKPNLNEQQRHDLFDYFKFASHASKLVKSGCTHQNYFSENNAMEIVRTDYWEKNRNNPAVYDVVDIIHKDLINKYSKTTIVNEINTFKNRADKFKQKIENKISKYYLANERPLLSKLCQNDNYAALKQDICSEDMNYWQNKLVLQCLDEKLNSQKFKNVAKTLPSDFFGVNVKAEFNDYDYGSQVENSYLKNYENKCTFNAIRNKWASKINTEDDDPLFVSMMQNID